LARGGQSGRTFYVSSVSGNDGSDGLSPQSAWRSLGKVNAAELRPGDKVLFQRDGSWRGTLVPRSGREGAPVTYGAYGEGARPLLLGSVSRNDPHDWHQEADNIWATAQPTVANIGSPGDLAAAAWSVYAEGGARVKTTVSASVEGTPASLCIECAESGARANHIQLIMPRVSIRAGDAYVLAFRVRCTKPFAIPHVELMKQSAPWTSYGDGGSRSMAVGGDWTDHEVRFKANHTADDGRITLFLGGALPAGATLDFQPVAWKQIRRDSSAELSVDVGNIIFEGGQAVGVKKWKAEDLKQEGDYWYGGDTWQVKLYSQGNPAERHKSIELALRRHIVDQGGKSYVVYEGLALYGGAAHGFGGGSTHHIVIRDCDVAWIGGGHQGTTAAGKPVRFGNGIEFWENAHDNLVEGCRIWEVYDAALTNQGSANNSQINILYRDNVIWNCEYSFEYWNRGPESATQNIRFEHNTCVNAGCGWGHKQRPDPNGRHLMFYMNSARTTGVCVVGNIFCDATDSCLRLENDWTAGLTMDRNCWWQRTGVLMQFLKKPFTAAQFADFQKQSHLDTHSMVAEPGFLHAERRDFRLSAAGAARTVAGNGNSAGAGRRLEE
jgi:hypothetical protein